MTSRLAARHGSNSSTSHDLGVMVTHEDLKLLFYGKYGDPKVAGWGPGQRLQFGYYTPDDIYEATVARLVRPGCAWLDAGCGRDVFPDNQALARELSQRCALLVGLDPSDTLDENTVVHQRERTTIEDFRSDHTFDLATFRMVAEHISQPQLAASALGRLMGRGGKVVIYTVNRWTPLAAASWFIPFRWHHAIKRQVWLTEERDTFPVVYQMNTRRRLRNLFRTAGFRECSFAYLDDCRASGRFRILNRMELTLWRLCTWLGVRYPENCLLGVYEKL